MLRMIKTILAAGLVGLMVCLFVTPVMAASDFGFPSDWTSWIKMREYKFPCTDVGEQPKVVQNTITIYCPLFLEDSLTSIWARPEAKAVLDAKTNDYPDGPNFIFSASNVQGLGHILLVKGHKLGMPVYGIFQVDGTDIEGAAKAVSKSTCISCHDAYCRPVGICSDQAWNNFSK